MRRRLIKKLGEVCEILIGGTPSRGNRSYWENGVYLWVSIADMSRNGNEITETKEKITDEGVKNSNVKFIPKGSLLFSFKLSIGKLAFAGEDLYTNEAIAGLVIKDEKELDKNYLFYYISQMTFEDTTSAVKGKTLNKQKILNLEIPLPPLSEQKKIVKELEGKLGKVKEAIKLRKGVLTNTGKILPTRLSEIFEEGKKEGWEEKILGDVYTFNYGKGLSKLERSDSGQYLVYGANGVLGKSDKYLIEGEGIIIGRKGSAGELTRVSGRYWPTDVTYFVTEDKEYNIDFSYYLLKSLNLPQYATGVKPGINRNQIYNIKISLPPLQIQTKIVKELDDLSERVAQLRALQETQLADLKSLEKAYLHEAFSG